MKAAGFLTNCLIIVFGKDKIMQVSRVSFSSIQLESGSCTICIPLKKVISFYAQLFADMKFPFTTYMCINSGTSCCSGFIQCLCFYILSLIMVETFSLLKMWNMITCDLDCIHFNI